MKLSKKQVELYRDINAYDPNAARNYLRSIHDFRAGRPWSPPGYTKKEEFGGSIHLIADSIANGTKIEDIARSYGVSSNTIHNHLRKHLANGKAQNRAGDRPAARETQAHSHKSSRAALGKPSSPKSPRTTQIIKGGKMKLLNATPWARGLQYIWEGIPDDEVQISGDFVDGLNRLPKTQKSQVARRFLRSYCETCDKEASCPLFFDFICDKPVTEWKVLAGLPFCEEYAPSGDSTNEG